ncbi:hypothetical protein EXIGLDRAFT_832732 [Exidia glandulosa HHB12029]|uniref:F-box domain-containing protein n=1 Tax=Exidia glandulosa HHB12029 TaxID=1314781 RepID=A0A166B3I0_EXIGL|nr:hypothetical protein EXIGLDRAFT_832732 [Exidia glandulosa HHB12029]
MDDVEHSIARAFEAAVQNLQEDDLGAFEQTYSDLGSQLGVMLARCMRRRNATSSFQSRLPDELWSAILEDEALMLSDYIHFSHVCHSWRRLSLLSPRLWRAVDFTTCRRTKCSCQACLDAETSLLDLQFARLEALLPRSGGLHLDLRLKCPKNDRVISNDFIRRLADALHPHTHRIARIQAGFDDRQRLCTFICSLESLPVLRYLSAATADGSVVLDDGASIPISRQRMPMLEHLNLSLWCFDYRVIPISIPEPMPSVQKVSYAFTEEEDLLRLLRSFPRLQSLALTPIDPNFPLWGSNTNITSEIRKRAESVEDVTLADVSSEEDHGVLFRLLHRRDMEAFTVRFTGTPPQTGSLASLSDLTDSDGVELVVNCIGGWGVSITAHTGKRRRDSTFHCYRLNVPTSRAEALKTVFSSIWEYLPLSSVDTLVVDAETWAALPPSPPSSASRTTELRVLLGDTEQYPFPWTGPDPARFPALTRMVVESRHSYPDVTAESLVQFIRTLGAEVNELEVLVGEGVVLVGDEAALRGMCRISRDTVNQIFITAA